MFVDKREILLDAVNKCMGIVSGVHAVCVLNTLNTCVSWYMTHMSSTLTINKIDVYSLSFKQNRCVFIVV